MNFVKKNLKWLVLSIVLVLIGAMLNILYSFNLGRMINSTIEKDIEMFVETLKITIFLLLSGGIFNYLGSKAKNIFTKKTTIDYKSALANKITDYNITKYFSNHQSFYLNTLTSEAETVRTRYFLQVGSVIHDAITLVCGIIALFYISWKYAIVVILLTFVPMLIPMTVGPILSKRTKQASENNEKYIVELKGILEGFEIIKSFGLKQRILLKYKKANYQREHSTYKVEDMNNLQQVLSFISAAIVIMVSIGFGTYLVFKGEINIGLLFAGIQIFNFLMNPIMGLSQRSAVMAGTKAIRKKHQQILNNETDNEVKGLSASSISQIELKDLSFAFSNEDVVKQINTKFSIGSKYAIIGASGSGKSTLLKLIMGYFNEYQGEINYNNIELKDINKNELYHNFTMIHQNIFLFEDSIEENIKLYKEVNEDKYYEAIKNANLVDVIEKLRVENNLELKDNGQQLSGGEKQRVAIARSLLLNTNFLLIDEATASLDPTNADLIYKTILGLKDIGCIAVTHDWSDDLLQSFDEVIYMDKGSIVCKGTWEDIKHLVESNNNMLSAN